MKSNNTQHKTRQFLCCDFGYICMYTQRSNNICFNWTRCSSQMLTKQSRCRERAACALISRRCGDHTDTLRDLLKFVQEIARFVTSSFFGKKTKSLWGSKKALSWQHCTHLCYSPLSVWLQQHTHFHTYRNIWTTANQRGVRPSLSLIGLDHDMSLMCVCCWTTGRLFFFSQTAGRTSATSDFC